MAEPTLTALARRIAAARPALGPVRLVCIDGPAGSGKTRLAGELAARLGAAPVVHLDDLYEGWSDALGPALTARLQDWLLTPLAAGRPGRYRVFDWSAGRYATWAEVPCAPVVILEGVGSGQRVVREHAVALVWIEAGRAERLRRVLARDGTAVAGPMTDPRTGWQAQEDAHFRREGTRAAATLRLDGSSPDARVQSPSAPQSGC